MGECVTTGDSKDEQLWFWKKWSRGSKAKTEGQQEMIGQQPRTRSNAGSRVVNQEALVS